MSELLIELDNYLAAGYISEPNKKLAIWKNTYLE